MNIDRNITLHLFRFNLSIAEIFYENFYTTQSNQKTGLQSQQRTNYPMAQVSLPPTPTNAAPQTNGKRCYLWLVEGRISDAFPPMWQAAEHILFMQRIANHCRRAPELL